MLLIIRFINLTYSNIGSFFFFTYNNFFLATLVTTLLL